MQTCSPGTNSRSYTNSRSCSAGRGRSGTIPVLSGLIQLAMRFRKEVVGQLVTGRRPDRARDCKKPPTHMGELWDLQPYRCSMGEGWTAACPRLLGMLTSPGTYHARGHHLPHLGRLHVADHNHLAVPHLLDRHKLDQPRDDLQGKPLGTGAPLHNLPGQTWPPGPKLTGITGLQQLMPWQTRNSSHRHA